MARIPTAEEKVFSIKSWLGINENPDGETNLKMGEAAAMSNFRITDDGSLQVRPGSANVAGLLSAYMVTTASTKTMVKSDTTTVTSTFTAYPAINVSEGGILSLSGTAVTVNQSNISSYGNYYCTVNSKFYRIGTCTKVVPPRTPIPGGSYRLVGSSNPVASSYDGSADIYAYPSIYASNGAIYVSTPASSVITNDAIGKFIKNGSTIYQITSYMNFDTFIQYWGQQAVWAGDDKYVWEFYEVTGTTTSSDVAVKGIWSGYVAGTEYIVAACNGHLWSLAESGGIWTKTDIGSISTTGKVLLFGFGNKLYILDGTDYRFWDGTTLTSVTGYVPIVATATPPAGGGTPLEQVNKLTGSKRQKFSPTGSATVFQLAETAIASVDWVKINGVMQTLTTHYTVNTSAGTVTFVTAPATGTNTVEIKWTKGTGSRAAILGMRYSEFYNGANDTRVFLYGDGTNKAFYSGLDENGQASAEYFPDLNVMSVGDSNTPITSMVRHYNRLLAFKEDSAYSVRYDIITLEDGTATAGFYVTPINRDIGNAACGQACLVENKPRTLDGRSIYEWVSVGTTLTGDQRNAQRISQRVEQTLGAFDLPSAVTYFDKINHEYYVVQNGKALVNNTENDTWYVYKDFPAVCLIVYKNDIYFGTETGYIRRFSRDYSDDCGAPITAYWESGSMDFGANFKRKYSPMLWVGLKPEHNAGVNVTVATNEGCDGAYEGAGIGCTRKVLSGCLSFLDMDFSRFSFGTGKRPSIRRLKLRVKDFTYYKLFFSSLAGSTATIFSTEIRVRYLGNVR